MYPKLKFGVLSVFSTSNKKVKQPKKAFHTSQYSFEQSWFLQKSDLNPSFIVFIGNYEVHSYGSVSWQGVRRAVFLLASASTSIFSLFYKVIVSKSGIDLVSL